MSDRVERVARAICNNRGIDPDALMGQGEPHRVYGGYIIHDTIPAWHYFAMDAVVAIQTIVKDAAELADAGGDIALHKLEAALS